MLTSRALLVSKSDGTLVWDNQSFSSGNGASLPWMANSVEKVI
jgi:hypothetical protein